MVEEWWNGYSHRRVLCGDNRDRKAELEGACLHLEEEALDWIQEGLEEFLDFAELPDFLYPLYFLDSVDDFFS